MTNTCTPLITYRILPISPAAHLYRISLLIVEPDSDGQIVQLPAWIPGSYLIREFARHMISIEAFSKNKRVKIEKCDKHTWQVAPCSGPLQLEYEVYAKDTSVRGSYLDECRGFLNGSSVFLSVTGQTYQPCLVELCRPQGEQYQSWRVITSLREHGAKRYGFGQYIADNYDELIDHPIEMGRFTLGKFTACGIPHEIAITGIVPKLDLMRVTRDLTKICTAHIRFFEPRTMQAPVERYVFLVNVVGEGYGGLEHRASSALLCARNDLPVQGKVQIQPTEKNNLEVNYRQFLGLCSHEYFHMWHIKRIKPATFVPYDLQHENYTRLLWLFEGFTSYYDDLMLFRSGVIDLNDYLNILTKVISEVMRVPGRLKQTLSESSFDAWIKYYRADENSPNSTVSYYTKGALVALALDLTIRRSSYGKKSLDDVMRLLWQQFGCNFYHGQARGIDEDQVTELFNQATGLKLDPWLNYAVDSTRELPLVALLEENGFALTAEANTDTPSLGVRLHTNGMINTLSQVYNGGPAQQGGLSAGDVLVAIDGICAYGVRLEVLLNRYQAGDRVEIHVFRHDELRVFRIKLNPPEQNRYKIVPISGKPQLIGAWPAAMSA